MLADMPMLPHHLAVPVVLTQQAAATAHVLRAFGEPAGPEQIAILQKMTVRTVRQEVVPLVHDLAAQADQIRGLAVNGGEQRESCRRPMLVIGEKPEITVAHRVFLWRAVRFSSSQIVSSLSGPIRAPRQPAALRFFCALIGAEGAVAGLRRLPFFASSASMRAASSDNVASAFHRTRNSDVVRHFSRRI